MCSNDSEFSFCHLGSYEDRTMTLSVVKHLSLELHLRLKEYTNDILGNYWVCFVNVQYGFGLRVHPYKTFLYLTIRVCLNEGPRPLSKGDFRDIQKNILTTSSSEPLSLT